jgi:broad specificity phosphatase PhoE
LNRSYAGLEALAGANEGSVFAIVTHSDVIRVIISYALGMPFDLMTRLVIDPGSISELKISGGFPEVRRINLCISASAPFTELTL